MNSVKGPGQALQRIVLFGGLLVSVSVLSAANRVPIAAKWGQFERHFRSSMAYSNALQQATLTVTFTAPGGETSQRPGFWDGGKTWRVRFSPDQLGHWTFQTSCSDTSNKGLHEQRGEFLCTAASGQTRFGEHGPIRVAGDQRHFQHADGTPFFWMADRTWLGAGASSFDAWQLYAGTRAAQQFTVTEWAVAPGQDAKKRSAWAGAPDCIAVQPEFFQALDAKIDTAARAGLLSAIVPVLDREQDQITLPDSQRALLVRYMLARWGAQPVVWVLAIHENDPAKIEHCKKLGQMVFREVPHAPVILELGSSKLLDQVSDEPWIDAVARPGLDEFTDSEIKSMFEGPFAGEWTKKPVRPLLTVLPIENSMSPQSKTRVSANQLRQAAYWGLLMAPPAGVCYGAQAVMEWDQSQSPETAAPDSPPGWQKSLFLPGARQMAHLARFMNSIEFWRLHPEPRFVAAQPGLAAPHRYIAASGTDSKDRSLVYVPEDRTAEILLEALPASPSVSWFNPRDGKNSPAVAVVGGSSCQFPTPEAGDWLLVMKAGK